MKLFIDTTDRNKIIIGIDDKKFENEAKEKSSQRLLPFIEELLKKENKNTKDISEINVNTGPGSFTGIRVGVAVANTLAYDLGIKVNGKDLEKNIKY